MCDAQSFSANSLAAFDFLVLAAGGGGGSSTGRGTFDLMFAEGAFLDPRGLTFTVGGFAASCS
jgi:hypothetical protein